MGSVYPPELSAMGNLCSIVAKEKIKTSPPHTLSELLSSVKLEDDPTIEWLQVEISRNVWLYRFHEFLVKRKLSDEIIALKFLVFTQPLKNQYSKKKTFGASVKDRRRLFSTVCHYFLSEESSISLDNESLFNDLLATYNSIKAGLQVSEESMMELLRARRDPLVWEEGLEPVYMDFASQAANNNHVACLLSLL